jgi:hypothetical protein
MLKFQLYLNENAPVLDLFGNWFVFQKLVTKIE